MHLARSHYKDLEVICTDCWTLFIFDFPEIYDCDADFELTASVDIETNVVMFSIEHSEIHHEIKFHPHLFVREHFVTDHLDEAYDYLTQSVRGDDGPDPMGMYGTYVAIRPRSGEMPYYAELNRLPAKFTETLAFHVAIECDKAKGESHFYEWNRKPKGTIRAKGRAPGATERAIRSCIRMYVAREDCDIESGLLAATL